MQANSAARPAQSPGLDRAIKVLALALALAVAGFAVFYTLDRQVKPSPGLVDQAIVQAEQAVRDDPGSTTARLALGDLYLEKRRFDEALAQYNAALEIDSKLLLAHRGRGRTYLAQQRYADAEVELQMVADALGGGEYAATDRGLEETLYFLARAQVSQQKLDAAVANLEKALKIDRTDADAWELLGSISLTQGRTADAIKAFEKTVLFVPSSPDAFAMLAQAYRSSGDDVRARYADAMVLYGRQDYDRAIAGLKAVTEERPDLAVAWTGLGFAYEGKGQKGDAAAAYQQALAADPNDFNARTGLIRLGVREARN